MVVPRLYLLRANHRCWTDYGQTGWLRITRYLSGTNKEAATLIGGKHKGYNRGRPTWLYRGSTSYEQTEWLRNALLVKRISCLVSQTESVGRHAAMTLPEKKPADTEKAARGNIPLPFPATALCKKAITVTRERPPMISMWCRRRRQCRLPRIVCGQQGDASSFNLAPMRCDKALPLPTSQWLRHRAHQPIDNHYSLMPKL